MTRREQDLEMARYWQRTIREAARSGMTSASIRPA